MSTEPAWAQEGDAADIRLAMVDVDFLRFSIDLQIQFSRHLAECEGHPDSELEQVTEEMEALSNHLLNAFSPVQWAQYYSDGEDSHEHE